MQISKKRLLAATLAATSLICFGGAVHAEDASGNTITVSSDDTSGDELSAGKTDSGNASNNTINISSGNFSKMIQVGVVNNGTASGNKLNVYGGNFSGGWLSGAYVSGNGIASGNVVNIHDGTFNVGFIEGSWGSGTHMNNVLNIYGGTINGGIISGAWIQGNNTATGNRVNILGGTISNAEIAGAYFAGGSGTASGNMISIGGNAVIKDSTIYGGYTKGTSEGNMINIYDHPDLSSSSIYAGSGGAVSGNTLNFYTSGITARNIGGFQYINFILPENYQKDTILTLNGGETTNLGDLSTVGFSSQGNSNVGKGDVLNLIRNDSGITLSDNVGTANLGGSGDTLADGTTTYQTKLGRGVSFDYDLGLALSPDGTTLTGTVGSHGGLKDNPTPISNPVPVIMANDNKVIDSLNDFGSLDFEDDDAEEGDKASKAEDVREQHGFEIFAHSGYGRLKTKTGRGSYVRTDNGNYDLGFARSLEMKTGKFIFAPIVEHSSGHYDAVMSDGRKGYGSAKYAAGGFIFRQINDNGFYYEASARAGRSYNDFISDHFKDANGNFVRATYHTSAPIFATHARIGKALRLNKNNILDVYGIYSYTRQGSMNAELSTGDPYEFSSVSSSRVRLGYRLTTRTSRISRIYTGLAWQYERNSDSEAKTYDAEGVAWSLNAGSKGSSGMLELGWQIKPNKDNPWLLDINATGWVGHQKGATAMAKIQKSF